MNPKTWSDDVRTGVIIFMQNLLNALILMQVVHLRDEQVAAIMLVVSTGTTLFFKFVKPAPRRRRRPRKKPAPDVIVE